MQAVEVDDGREVAKGVCSLEREENVGRRTVAARGAVNDGVDNVAVAATAITVGDVAEMDWVTRAPVYFARLAVRPTAALPIRAERPMRGRWGGAVIGTRTVCRIGEELVVSWSWR